MASARAELRLVPLSDAKRRTTGRSDGHAKARKGRYHYPKSLLQQKHFCASSTGPWWPPSLSLEMVSSPEFKSPLGALLDQLEREGHDVSGARIEWLAYRERIEKLCQDFNKARFEISSRLDSLVRAWPVLAHDVYNDPTKGGSPPPSL